MERILFDRREQETERKKKMVKFKEWLIKNMTVLIAGTIGAFVFITIYGTKILNPCYTDWLMSGGDLSQHYLGWKMYRNGDWTFPIGLTDQLAYPYYTSVIFTDSIPIFAVFFKLLSPFQQIFSILDFGELCALLFREYCPRRFYKNF